MKYVKCPEGEKVTCSFCSNSVTTLALRSEIDNSIICHECVDLCGQMANLYPCGVLRCIKCSFYKFISVRYNTATVVFGYAGQDTDDIAIYAPVQASKAWDRQATFQEARCGKCKTVIPFKTVYSNPYVINRPTKQVQTDPQESA